MSARPPLVFKFANEDWEFEQIHRLNYRTFVEEIPQHHASPTHRLVDRFHPENTYLICLSGRKLAGMLAARGNRPFSLDQKLENLDSYLPAGRKVCEIRLLAIEKKPPYESVVYRVTKDVIAQGLEEWQNLEAMLKVCEDTNRWPAEYEDETDLMIPAWATENTESLDEFAMEEE